MPSLSLLDTLSAGPQMLAGVGEAGPPMGQPMGGGVPMDPNIMQMMMRQGGVLDQVAPGYTGIGLGGPIPTIAPEEPRGLDIAGLLKRYSTFPGQGPAAPDPAQLQGILAQFLAQSARQQFPLGPQPEQGNLTEMDLISQIVGALPGADGRLQTRPGVGPGGENVAFQGLDASQIQVDPAMPAFGDPGSAFSEAAPDTLDGLPFGDTGSAFPTPDVGGLPFGDTGSAFLQQTLPGDPFGDTSIQMQPGDPFGDPSGIQLEWGSGDPFGDPSIQMQPGPGNLDIQGGLTGLQQLFGGIQGLQYAPSDLAKAQAALGIAGGAANLGGAVNQYLQNPALSGALGAAGTGLGVAGTGLGAYQAIAGDTPAEQVAGGTQAALGAYQLAGAPGMAAVTAPVGTALGASAAGQAAGTSVAPAVAGATAGGVTNAIFSLAASDPELQARLSNTYGEGGTAAINALSAVPFLGALPIVLGWFATEGDYGRHREGAMTGYREMVPQAVEALQYARTPEDVSLLSELVSRGREGIALTPQGITGGYEFGEQMAPQFNPMWQQLVEGQLARASQVPATAPTIMDWFRDMAMKRAQTALAPDRALGQPSGPLAAIAELTGRGLMPFAEAQSLLSPFISEWQQRQDELARQPIPNYAVKL